MAGGVPRPSGKTAPAEKPAKVDGLPDHLRYSGEQKTARMSGAKTIPFVASARVDLHQYRWMK